MTPTEIDRVAACINQLRPDWPVASLRTLIETKLGSRSRRDVAVAMSWVACDSTTLTPARVLEAGPWWRATNVDGSNTYMPPRTEEACRLCGRHAETCLCPTPTTRPPIRTAPSAEYLAAKQQLGRTPKETP